MHGKSLSLLWTFSSLSVAVAAGGFWLSLGQGTGVRWNGSTAPEWWVVVYLAVGFAILPVSAWLGYVIAKREMRRQ